MEKRSINNEYIENMQINLGYPLFQMAKAFSTSDEHDDPDTRKRAKEKIGKWKSVLTGLLDGSIDVGSRTPLEGVPAWATLEVITGGFATGELRAGGPLQEHEIILLEKLSAPLKPNSRRFLNGYFLTDEGINHLHAMLISGCYQIALPEEGALLVVVWLLKNGYPAEADTLLDSIVPWFEKLRFYPIPTDQCYSSGMGVFLQDVATTIQGLSLVPPNSHILEQKEAISVWNPIYDRIVSLFLETVEGPIPHLQTDSNGKWKRSNTGAFPVVGGWPCQRYSDDWFTRGKSILDEFHYLRKSHRLCGRPDSAKSSIGQLRQLLQKCVDDPKSLTGRDVGKIRMMLARYITKRGTPDSTTCKLSRQKQEIQIRGPIHYDLAQIIMKRLERYPPEEGIENWEEVIQPASSEESKIWNVDEKSTFPKSILRKAQRCQRDSIDHLVKHEVITSGEVLAQVLPQITSEIQSSGILDPSLRHLYSAMYKAFRKRRSLLLLNFEKQVQIAEIPWIAAIEPFRNSSISTNELAKQTLEELVKLTINSFPYAILPNKLLQEFNALIKSAELDIPLVEEVAVDIFMGDFSNKFLKSAKIAAGLVEKSLYADYYGIDYPRVKELPEANKPIPRWDRRVQKDEKSINSFIDFCVSRAGVPEGTRFTVRNGMIIEQQQIVTTQNLAQLISGMDLIDTLRDRYRSLAEICFKWICKRLQMKVTTKHANLIQIKSAAYAWRQMIFYLSFVPTSRVKEFQEWADNHLREQPGDFGKRFNPFLQGLCTVSGGETNHDKCNVSLSPYLFLGWSGADHKLLTVGIHNDQLERTYY